MLSQPLNKSGANKAKPVCPSWSATADSFDEIAILKLLLNILLLAPTRLGTRCSLLDNVRHE